MKVKKIKIGVVGVDSGQILVCDPCYIASQWKETPYSFGTERTHEFSYDGCCKETVSSPDGGGQLNYKEGHPGAGVVVRSGYGDGVYPVYITLTSTGRVKRLEIVFF